MSGGGGMCTEIIIPELEEARETGKIYMGGGIVWTPEEEAIMQRYYGYVRVKQLMKHLPGRTANQVTSKAQRMGINNRGRT